MEKLLAQLQPGQKGKVSYINSEGALRRRMMDMGIVPGVEIEVVRYALLGGPIQIRLRGYHLAMRRSEAAKIVVTSLNEINTHNQLLAAN